MQASKLCPAPHIEAAELEGDTPVTIKSVAIEGDIGTEKVTKGVIYFEEFDRGMVVNRTNTNRIVAWHGKETDEWIGKQITLYPSETDFNGQTVPCIRVRVKK